MKQRLMGRTSTAASYSYIRSASCPPFLTQRITYIVYETEGTRKAAFLQIRVHVQRSGFLNDAYLNLLHTDVASEEHRAVFCFVPSYGVQVILASLRVFSIYTLRKTRSQYRTT